jgi:ADP-ribose pyrophosphatase
MPKKSIIPNNAELMFSGVRSQIYLPDGRILLTRQEQPGRSQFISLPGGSFDSPDEDPVACARRELREETGYTTDTLVEWMRYHGTNNVHTEVHYYIARDCIWE